MKCTVTIEDVKKAALKLLGATLSDDITGNSIPALIEKDETYAQYLLNMDESINRAIQRMVNEGVLPEKVFSLEYAESYPAETGVRLEGWSLIFDIESAIKDFRELIRVDLINSHGDIVTDIHYGIIGGSYITLPQLKAGQGYQFTYKYSPALVSPFMELSEKAKKWQEEDIDAGEGGFYGEGAYNKNTLDIPDELAHIIPKFVFGELYMQDEPTMAMYQGINQFEAYLANYKPATNVRHNRIKNIYEGFN